MTASLRALLQGVFDYAGMFPPARLSLDAALSDYVHYRAGEDAWMLGRFVCPAERLHELHAGAGLELCAIGRGGENRQDWFEGLEADLTAIQDCRTRHGGAVQIDTLELRMPPAEGPIQVWMRELLDAVLPRLAAAELFAFFEIPLGEAATWAALLLESRGRVDGGRVGYKLRGTGLTASDRMTVAEQLASLLIPLAAAGMPFKATAGLHHPLPRVDGEGQLLELGFLPLLVTAILCRSGRDRFEEIEEALRETDPTSFQFDATGMSWRAHRLSLQQILEARVSSLVSIGSCSFDEPRNDLRALEWL